MLIKSAGFRLQPQGPALSLELFCLKPPQAANELNDPNDPNELNVLNDLNDLNHLNELNELNP